jgi:hypothetical protein
MTETFEIPKAKAIAAYLKADEAGKDWLNELLGEKIALSEEPMDWVNTFELVCAAAGVSESDYAIPVAGSAKNKANAFEARLELIERVFNGDWVANLADTTQKKYYAWGNILPDSSRPFGFRLSYGDYGYVGSYSDLGARPYFKDGARAIYVFKTFTAEYEGWLYNLNLSKQKQ